MCSCPAATTHSGAALCQGMVPSRQGRILSRNHSAGMRWGTQELCSAEDQPPGLTPSTQNTSQWHWQPPPRAAHTTHRCWYHPAELAVPGAHGHGTLLPSSAHPTSASSSQPSFPQSTRCKASMHPSQPSPANIPGAQPGTHRRWSLREGAARQERALQEGKQLWNRGAQREPDVEDRARKGCLSRSAQVPLTPRTIIPKEP